MSETLPELSKGALNDLESSPNCPTTKPIR